MSTITTGWYLFSTNTDKSWNELKKDWGLENCTLFQYIYELTGVPIANETQLGNNNWSPINVGSNNPNLKRYTAYWVNVINVTNDDNQVSQTIFYYSNTTTTRPDGLTSITSNSYSSNDLSLNSVYIGSNVTSIGTHAFLDATSLTSVIFATGSQLESIGQNAFQGASSLTSITIPAGVSSIGQNAFYGASSLTSISIPAGVSSIGQNAFSDMTSLASFTVNQSNNKYRDVSGVLFDSSGATLIQYPLGSTKTRYDIPTSVINIGINAFQFATGLKSITIPSSVESIGEGAFYGATTLASITIPSSVKSIGEGAFSTATNLESVIFESDSSLNSIGQYLFQGATKLESITIPASVTNIESNAFSFATNLRSVVFEADSSLNVIGNYAFQGVSRLASIIIPSGVTSIGASAFQGATSLATVTFDSISNLISIGQSAFQGVTSLASITIPVGVTKIEYSVFAYASNLASVIFEADSSLNIIGESAFLSATSLASITIPASVTEIGPSAFQGATSLTTVIFEADSQLTSIGETAFYDVTSLVSITIPKSVTEIGADAFQGARDLSSVLIEISRFDTAGFPATPGKQSYFESLDTTNFIAYKLFSGTGELSGATAQLNGASIAIIEGYSSIGPSAFQGTNFTSITIPATVTSIGTNAFRYASALTYITVNQSNTRFKDINGVLFNKDGTTLIRYPIGNTRTIYEIPATVTSIGQYAFQSALSLTSITIPASVTSIGTGAFQGMASLVSITIPASVTEIGVGAFYGARNLTYITVNQSNTHFKDINGVLFNKYGTTLIRYSIGNTRTSYEIPATVTSIGTGAFHGTNFTSITIPATVTSIGDYAFSLANSLTTVTFAQGSQVTSIGYGAFQSTSLTSIIIPASVTEIGNYVVPSPSTANFTVYIANYQGQLGIRSPATDVDFFGTTVTTKNISYSDNGTTATFLGASGQTLGNGDNDGDGINKLNRASEAIIVGYSSIADYEFLNASSLTSVTISASVTSIGNHAFIGTSNLTSVIFEEGSQLKSIGSSAFWSATSLTSITIPEGVTEIGSNAFYSARKLATVWIHEDTVQRLNTNPGSQLPLNVSTDVSFYGQQINNFNVYQTANSFYSRDEYVSYEITESTNNATINTLNFALTGGSVYSGLIISSASGILLIYQLSSSVLSGQGNGTTRLFNKTGQSEIESYSEIYNTNTNYINMSLRVEANTKYVIVFGCPKNTTGTLKIKMYQFY